MNDPNRKIVIDKSSLLSLKAELLRKQEEVSRAKALNSIDDFVPKRVPKSEHPTSGSLKDKNKNSASAESGKAVELEDSAALERSKRVLKAKARYYDRMVASGGSLNSDENCLVMFNHKKQSGKPSPINDYGGSSDESNLSSDDEGRKKAGDGDWVEFTDFLGRSRKCRREELDECIRKDKEQAQATGPREGQQEHPGDDTDEEGEIIGPVPSMAITEDTIGDRFREMREQWAKQDAENLEKDSVTYQDVLFDEARQHGVGYYAFSTDREERTHQQHELDALREATIDAQKEKDDLRKARDKIIADRVKAAKARQRARLGLPPEEEEPQTEAKDEELYDTTAEKKRLKAEAKEKKNKEKEEKKRNRERLKHVRPWDEGKELDEQSEWKPAREWHVMSQEEWNEMKRKERISEFAPPVEKPTGWVELVKKNPLLQASQNDANDSGPNDEEEDEDDEEQIGPLPLQRFDSAEERIANNPLLTSAHDEAEEIYMPTVPGMENLILPEETNRTLFFTTKKKEFKRRNYDAFLEPAGTEKQQKLQQNSIPIRNELSDSSEDECEHKQSAGMGVQIPPPPTFDYYGPTSSLRAKPNPRQPPVTKTALEASIEAGLKFLRNQSDKGGPSIATKNKWTTNADY
ncbi:coiled-coil domain-containing protein 174 [Topomyia yanbarensis]|uniref:coiled-coil domain-containing protein 174 n=1 Tax=Topomyia yanbarensis TaxID=2498891 RepID=UPI00273BC260|nr:coiled-coil domain-containing protein 174 [Topomyia yanbarensis]XP_058822463.1 coiled-coil domain-containing protein 174 [Topomyia yanbarensis]